MKSYSVTLFIVTALLKLGGEPSYLIVLVQIALCLFFILIEINECRQDIAEIKSSLKKPILKVN